MMKMILIVVVTVFCTFLWCQPVPEGSILWNFQDTLIPVDINITVEASAIAISEGNIQFMDGFDDNGTRIGYAPDENWRRGLQPDFNDPKYFEFSFRPDLNHVMYVTSMELRLGRNAVGPRAIVVQFSTDGFENPGVTLIQGAEVTSQNPNLLNRVVVPFQEVLRYQSGEELLTVRIWAYGAQESEDEIPTLYMNNFRVNGFTLPFPAIALVLDRSGSMGSENFGSNYWQSAIAAAQVFVDEVMFDLDAVCVVSYAVEEMIPGFINAVVEFPMRWSPTKISRLWPVPTDPDVTVLRQEVIGAINEIEPPAGRTSIGSGIIKARDELLEAYEQMPGGKAMILLSDGLDNWQPFAREVVTTLPAEMSIYAITLGGNTDFTLMRDLARMTGGSWVHSPNTVILREIYIYIYLRGLRRFENHYRQRRSISSFQRNVHTVIVDNQTQDINFLLITEGEPSSNQSLPLDFLLRTPSGLVIDSPTAQNSSKINFSQGLSVTKFEILLPEPGEWQLIVSSELVDDESYLVSAYGTSGIKMIFNSNRADYRVNEPVNLSISLHKNGNPITSSRVTGIINLPDEDIRNHHYSNAANTPFADYERNKTVNRLIERTRNNTVELVFNETAPGLYEAVFTDTETAGPYNIEIQASSDDENLFFNRQLLETMLINPPEQVGTPYLSFPENNAEGLDTRINFVWSDIITANAYHFQLANNHQILYDLQNVESNQLIIDSLSYNTRYIWRVKALRGEEDGIWSQIYSFTTGIPDIPVPHSLQGYAENNSVFLSWQTPPETCPHFGEPISYQVYRNHRLLAESDLKSFCDDDILMGSTYSYYVKAVYKNDTVSPPSNSVRIMLSNIDEDADLPLLTGIKGNYPNPFNPETTIMFTLAEPVFTEITIYNISGRKVKTLISKSMKAGSHSVTWNSLDNNNHPVSGGIYMIKMETNNYSGYKKILLLK